MSFANYPVKVVMFSGKPGAMLNGDLGRSAFSAACFTLVFRILVPYFATLLWTSPAESGGLLVQFCGQYAFVLGLVCITL